MKVSDGNTFRVCSEEWWHFEVEARMRAFARECAELGAVGQFGVYDADLPTPEGGLAKRLGVPGVDRGVFRMVNCPRPDWLVVTALRWEDRPGLWQFGESLVLARGDDPDNTESVGLFAKLDFLLRRAVNRLATEADGLCCRARVGWMIRAGVLTVGTKIDALVPFATTEVSDAHG